MKPAIVFLLGAMATAQTPTEPTFQAGTKLVEVEVVARHSGKPASGLTKEDFTLTDDGKRQNIAFFSVRSLTTPRHNAETPLPPGTYSNRLAHDTDSPGRTTVILLDQMNTSQELQAWVIPRIGKSIGSKPPADRLAIYTITGRGLHVVQDLTGDPALLKRAATSLKGRNPDPRINDTTGMSKHEAEGYDAMNIMGPAMTVRNALREIARHLSNVPGRKNVVWVTTAFPLYIVELGLDFRPEMEQAAHALNNANVALYAVDARALMGALQGLTSITPAEAPGPPANPHIINMLMHRGEPADPRGLNTEQMLSGLTGGLTFFNKSNAIEESIETAVEDGDFTYTLGFYPDPAAQDGKWHDLKVHVARGGIELRYRRNYFAGSEDENAPTLDQILKEPLDSTQLALRAEAHLDPARPQILNLKVNIDLHDVAFSHANSTRTGAIDLSFYIEGAHRVFKKPLRIEIPDARFDAALEKGLDAVAPVNITGGGDALRIIAQDKTTGAAGSVTVPLPAK